MYWIYLLISAPFLMLQTNSQVEHPIHETRTEIHYKEKAKRLEIAVRILTDDLEEALKKEYKEAIEIGTDNEHPKAEEYILSYINKQLKLEIDEKNIELEFIGREVDEQDDFALWTYLKVDNLKRWKVMQIKNTLLMSDYHRHQENIVTVNAYGKSKKVTLRNNKYKKVVMK
ncbi:MAG: hypothetical protein MK212_00505 [Saprospiraceae bacterium]|nr:hypothetical protein [Saprospiraceae bacterium]